MATHKLSTTSSMETSMSVKSDRRTDKQTDRPSVTSNDSVFTTVTAEPTELKSVAADATASGLKIRTKTVERTLEPLVLQVSPGFVMKYTDVSYSLGLGRCCRPFFHTVNL